MKIDKVTIRIADFKDEAITLLNLYPEDVVAFRADQLPQNILEAKGHDSTYYHGIFAVIQRYGNMRAETYTELPGILMRMNKSRGKDDPPPSLVDLEKHLRRIADAEDRPNLKTAARGIASLIELLGQSARIRTVKQHE